MDETGFQFANPPLEALRGNQRDFSMTRGLALKYPADVTPFAALVNDSPEAWADLHSLMEPDETTWLIGDEAPVVEGLRCVGPIGVLQMTYPEGLAVPVVNGDGIPVEALSCAHAEEMVGLTAVAFPGFFRRRTCAMGSYYGIRENGRLVAMCGERMAIGEFREISGLCALPEVRGRGYAALLMTRLMRDHQAAGLRSYLHVTANNDHAIALYRRMGFAGRGELPFYRVTREG